MTENEDDCSENLISAHQKLSVKTEENEKLIEELAIADKELDLQHDVNEKLTEKLIVADLDLIAQNEEIRRNEEQIKFARQDCDALINNITDLMWSIDTDLKLITSNKAFDDMVEKMSGKANWKGRSVLRMAYPSDQLLKYTVCFEKAFAGQSFTEIFQIKSSPSDEWSEISFCPIVEGSKTTGVACCLRDITELKNAELKHAENTNALLMQIENLSARE